MTLLRIVCISLVAGLFAGCRGQVSEEPPIVPIRNMYNQPRYDPQERSEFFQDHRTMRPLVEGTVAIEMEPDETLTSGRSADGSAWLLETPTNVVRDFFPGIDAEDWDRGRATPRQPRRGWAQLSGEEQQGARRAMLDRGHQRFDIYCAPCHSVAGDGEGPVNVRARWLAETQRDPGSASLAAPTLHDDRIRSMPDGQLYATITHGIRNMPAYSQSIPMEDRWAIVSYVRALQLSQAARTANSGAR